MVVGLVIWQTQKLDRFLIATYLQLILCIHLMKNLLATVCLFLIGSLTVSVFSPGIHKSLFHGDSECAHSKTKVPCSDHGDHSSNEEDSGSCAVILFGKSIDAAVAIDRVSRPSLLLEEIFRLFSERVETLKDKSNRWARGPPSVG